MSNNKDIVKTNIFEINLATNQLPEYKIDKTKKIVTNGDKNDHPGYLLYLYNNHAEHGQIVRGKARYVSGLSIKSKDQNEIAEAFLSKANESESWYQFTEKTDLDDAIFGGHFVKVESNALGQPVKWYHVPYASVRISDDYEHYIVCEDWKNYWKNTTTPYPKFKEGFAGVAIEYVRDYSPAESKIKGLYAQPEYMSCILDIDTDIRIGSFFNNYIRNNFSSGTMVIIPNGETDAAKKQNIVDRFKHEHNGEDKAGNTVFVFTPKDSTKDVQVLSLNSNDLDKQYDSVSKRDKEKIVAGHGVNGALFKIKMDDKALLSREELTEQHELFLNEYVKAKQIKKINNIKRWFKMATGQDADFEIEQIQLIGLDLPLDNQNVISALNERDPNIIINYIIEKFGIKVPEKLGANGLPVTNPITESSKPNDFLKGLSAKENMDLIRIVRDFEKGKLNEPMAMARIRAYSIDDITAKEILGINEAQTVQQSSQEKNKKVKELFLKYAHDIQEDEVLEVVNFSAIRFYEALNVSVNQLRSAVLNQLKGNPFSTVQELAKNFQTDENTIQSVLNWLKEKSLLDISDGTLQPTEKAMGKETEPIETEIYTEYTYQLRPELKAKGQPALLSTSRQDCIDWYNMTRKKAITYEAIQNLKNEFGDSAWDFRGGFWNNNGEIENTCRHYWEGQTKIRRKQK